MFIANYFLQKQPPTLLLQLEMSQWNKKNKSSQSSSKVSFRLSLYHVVCKWVPECVSFSPINKRLIDVVCLFFFYCRSCLRFCFVFVLHYDPILSWSEVNILISQTLLRSSWVMSFYNEEIVKKTRGIYTK